MLGDRQKKSCTWLTIKQDNWYKIISTFISFRCTVVHAWVDAVRGPSKQHNAQMWPVSWANRGVFWAKAPTQKNSSYPYLLYNCQNKIHWREKSLLTCSWQLQYMIPICDRSTCKKVVTAASGLVNGKRRSLHGHTAIRVNLTERTWGVLQDRDNSMRQHDLICILH